MMLLGQEQMKKQFIVRKTDFRRGFHKSPALDSGSRVFFCSIWLSAGPITGPVIGLNVSI